MSTDGFPTFAEFFRAVHGHNPFPWQTALADRLMAGEQWPDAVDVPTGLGKTSLLDVAVYASAAGAEDRRRRVFFVVDRRLVVDEAFDHADHLTRLLNNPAKAEPAHVAALRAVADRLRQPEDSGPVVEVTRMRGGAAWSWQWVQRPDRHSLVVGTVDQIGSRLFMRGYGVSDRRRPIDAALVGTDSLILVDEAHLAQAMLTSIDKAVADQPQDRLARPRVVQMSATVRSLSKQRVHSITDDDRAHPVASKRLEARRQLYLVEPKVTKKNADQVMADQLVSWSQALAADQPVGPVVLTVCNTIARARAAFDLLADREVPESQRVLLIGRSRLVDRQRLMDAFYRRIKVDRDRVETEPLYVVATQTVEVGANIDADVLVSESASMAALIQRLGRLARTAEARTSNRTAPAVVVHDASVGDGDPIYGSARQATWSFLSGLTSPLVTRKGRACVVEDLGDGIEASPIELAKRLGTASDEEREAMREPVKAPPLMHEGILRSWEHTSPSPVTDPPVAPFLHGLDTREPDVTLIWRDDIDPATCLDPAADEVASWVEERLRLVPPTPDEQVQVSVSALRRWRGRKFVEAGQIADVEGGTAEPVEDLPDDEYVLRYHGRQDLERITVKEVRPGDTVLLPSRWGGCDRYGWAPHSRRPVADVADMASHREYPVVRLEKRLIVSTGLVEPGEDSEPSTELRQALDDLGQVDAEPQVIEDVPKPEDYKTVLSRVRALIPHHKVQHPLAKNITLLANAASQDRLLVKVLKERPVDEEDLDGKTEKEPGLPQRSRIVLAVLRKPLGSDGDEASTSITDEEEPVLLDDHQRDVARQAATFARNIGLPEQLVHAVYLAGLYHDEGKRDPRFQALLQGLPVADPEQVWAKSLNAPTDPADRRQALNTSGYPAGTRHEGLSARLAEQYLAKEAVSDELRDLVLHLISSHHGHSRPVLPAITDPSPVRVSAPGAEEVTTEGLLDWRSPARFTRLNKSMGRWKLALLESVVRMADMWCSAGESVTATEHQNPQQPSEGSLGVMVQQEHTVALPALDGRDPLGFLASLGVLRLLSDQADPAWVGLSFDPVTATARITGPLKDLDSITAALQEVAASVHDEGVLPDIAPAWPPQIGVGKDPLRVPRQQLEELHRQARKLGESDQASEWLRSIVTDLAAETDGRVMLTPFMAPAGGQKAATFFSKSLELVRKNPDTIREALIGWQRLEGCTGENLDHRAIRTAVDTNTGASTPSGVPGATWLATQALPLLALSGDGRHMRSSLWHRHNGRRVMLWPVWKDPLETDAVQVLLDHPGLAPQRTNGKHMPPQVRRQALRPLGVLTVAAAHRRPIPGGKSAGVITPMHVDIG